MRWIYKIPWQFFMKVIKETCMINLSLHKRTWFNYFDVWILREGFEIYCKSVRSCIAFKINLHAGYKIEWLTFNYNKYVRRGQMIIIIPLTYKKIEFDRIHNHIYIHIYHDWNICLIILIYIYMFILIKSDINQIKVDELNLFFMSNHEKGMHIIN